MGSKLCATIGGGLYYTLLPNHEYKPLNLDVMEQRFLIVHPCPRDKIRDINYRLAEENHVRCTMEIHTPPYPPYTALDNTRGYWEYKLPIEVDGCVILVTSVLERFLRVVNLTDAPIRLWGRHPCLVKYPEDKMFEEECHRCVTRPHLDMMYSRAFSVVDMSLQNMQLISRGLLRKTGRKLLHERKWNEGWPMPPNSKEMVSFHSPIKIGKTMNYAHPVDYYEHVPLDFVADEIRMVKIEESEDPSGPIVTRMPHVPIIGIPYMALSYTWGTSDARVEIGVAGQRMYIRKNLERILRALKAIKCSIVWIDAMCINQLDVLEKPAHLPRMAEIYHHAAMVICYVGEPDEDTGMAVEFVDHLQEEVMQFDLERKEWKIGPEDNRIGADQHPRLCAALYRLLMRPYFRRVWILQEVANAVIPVIQCGTQLQVMLERLDHAAAYLQFMLQHGPLLAYRMTKAAPDLGDVSTLELTYIRKLFYFRHLACRGENFTHAEIYAKIGEQSPGFLEALILTRDFQATDGHDKIFSMGNIVKERVEFHSDYSQPIPKTFADFAVALAMKNGSLDVIAAAELLSDYEGFYRESPGWCPDWTTPSRSSCLVRKERIPLRATAVVSSLDGAFVAADNNLTNKASEKAPENTQQPSQRIRQEFFDFEGHVLKCTGVILDQISVVFDDPKLPRGFLSQPPDPKTYYKYHYWLHKIEEFFEANSLTTYEDPLQAAIAMFHGDVPAAWPPRHLNPVNAADRHPFEQFVCDPSRSRHVLQFMGDYARVDAYDIVRMTLHGRTLCVTENGYMVLAPDYVAENDPERPWLLAILATCSVPVLLKENDDGTYRFSGTCFVQGWMEGEVFAETMGVDTPQEFWSAMADSGRLSIV
ncbi:heterokaryon incompatibility protein-domain-containing protein [Whalleya microplaca]|nr:heterokaryon incompatibility protein-domain-containing protein [Whalleya microplaca]